MLVIFSRDFFFSFLTKLARISFFQRQTDFISITQESTVRSFLFDRLGHGTVYELPFLTATVIGCETTVCQFVRSHDLRPL